MKERLSFWEHIEELRLALVRSGWALLGATVFSFYFHKQIIALLLKPLSLDELYIFSPFEGFSIALKLSFWMGAVLASPIWLTAVTRFILPALHNREKKYLLPFLGLSFLAICLSLVFAYAITLPLVVQFFQKFNGGLALNYWGFGQTLDFILMLILAHVMIFELYVGLFFLIKLGLVTHIHLKKGRRAFIALSFVLAAILTPPDLLSQLLLALPMLALYEACYAYARLRKKVVKAGC